MHTYCIDTGTRTLTHTGTPESAVNVASKFCYIGQQTRETLSKELAVNGRATASYGFTCVEIHRK